MLFLACSYQYRLCPANSTLDEECFRKMPLRFVGQQSFRWGGVGGKQYFYNGTYVTQGWIRARSFIFCDILFALWLIDFVSGPIRDSI